MQNIKYNFKNIKFDIIEDNIDLNDLVPKFIKKSRIKKGYMSVIVSVEQANEKFFSLGLRYPLEIQNQTSVEGYIEYLKNKSISLDDKYKAVRAIAIYFNYTKINLDSYKHSKTLFEGKETATLQLNKVDFRNEQPANLPLNTNYTTWGPVERLGSNNLKIRQTLNTKLGEVHRLLYIQLLNKFNKIIEIYTNSNILLSKVTDKFLDPFGNEFTRQIGDKCYHIKNNAVYFIFENLYLDYQSITKARIAKKFTLNMLTLDIETYVNEDKTMSIYCISIYDGDKCHSYFLTDYNSITELMADLFKKLFTREYSQKTVYIHNSNNFDLVFLLKYLVNKDNTLIEPIIKDGKFINLRIKYGPKFNYYINFKDSFLILSSSLDKLTLDFKVDMLKGAFPHEFVNATNLDYVGEVPSLSYFNNTNMNPYDYVEYTNKFNKNWNLKNEAIKYCERDCIALYQTMMKFSELIFKEFGINVSSVSTLPSLAFKIFRAKFLDKNIKLPVISGKIYDDIYNAYFGGHCDMYIPKSPQGKTILEYDCNSLFPFVMKENKYPGKILGYFRGDISNMSQYSNLFNENLSYLKVKVNAPKDLKHPILPHRTETVSVYGVGTWTDWYYSDEIKNAEKYGYKFQILEGYIFEPVTVFAEYVNKIFKMKYSAKPNTPTYAIAKLLLNTLYGRFGLSPKQLNHEVISKDKLSQRITEIGLDRIEAPIFIGDSAIISYFKPFSKVPLINVAIAAAIPANARSFMTQFKNNPKFNLYYTDTDSIFIDGLLPSQLKDEKALGKFKLVEGFRKFVSLAPKVYGGITVEGDSIVKSKGIKTKVPYALLESLLSHKALTDKAGLLKQPQWIRSIQSGTITEREIELILRPTDYKRNLIYKNGYLVGTSNKEFNE